MNYRGHRTFKPLETKEAQVWFEGKEHEFLSEFRSEVYRLVKSLGHDNKWCETWDENTGIGVTRL